MNLNLLNKRLKDLEYERYAYITKNGINMLFQRLNKDSLWYVVYDNQIINYSQYRNDLEEWCEIIFNNN